MIHAFTVACVPPKTTSQQKGACNIGGKIRFFTKGKVRQSQNDMMTLLMPHVPERPLAGPLRLCVTLTFPWRATEKKRNMLAGWMYNDKNPDFDNVSKSLCDVMTKLLFWTDDGQIADGRIIKKWGDHPGIAVEIEELAGADE